MECPLLGELPPPQPGKAGWPWTEPSSQLPESMPDGAPWPPISIVTPSYNQGDFVEETLRSVLLQGYPNLEYIVMDGGSTDATVSIIQEYSPWITYWTSGPDSGQANALRKGFARAKGNILGWINSDDFLAPGALGAVAEAWHREHPTIVAGTVVNFVNGAPEKRTRYVLKGISFPQLLRPWEPQTVWHQPGMFFNGEVYRQVGGIDPRWHIGMDYDLFLRLLAHRDHMVYVDDTIAFFREHAGSKTTGAERLIARLAVEQCQVVGNLGALVNDADVRLWEQKAAADIIYRSALALRAGKWEYLKKNLDLARGLGVAPFIRAIISKTAREGSQLLPSQHKDHS